LASNADQGERVDAPRFDPRGHECLRRRRQERRPLVVESFGLGRRLAPGPSREVLAAAALEVGVEGCQATVDDRHRHEEFPACEADERLDVPLLVRPPDQAEMRFEQVITLESEERVGDLAFPAPEDLGDGDLGVVVADPARHPAEEGEGPDVTFEERLGALAREGDDEDRVGVRQGHDEEGDLRGRPIELDFGLTEIDLGLAGGVGQRDEDLGGSEPPGGDLGFDDGQAASVAMLVAEPLEDPVGGVPLLPGGLLVGLEDLVDDGQEWFELGPGPCGGPTISRWLGVVEDLLERVPVDVELAADGSFALAVDEDATADLGLVLHVGVHP
jgi:hypothetical protein